jgi:hypothetical protein
MSMDHTRAQTGEHDFDFFLGTWRARNRRLTKHFQASEDWIEFEASHYCVSLLGGLGNMDELHSDEHGLLGMSIRFFNKLTQQWNIWWVATRDGVLQPPVAGAFRDGRGVFEGPDDLGGKPILVRYEWSDVSANSARWQQAFSQDNGATWEVNWIMDFSRVQTQ